MENTFTMELNGRELVIVYKSYSDADYEYAEFTVNGFKHFQQEWAREIEEAIWKDVAAYAEIYADECLDHQLNHL